MAVFKNQNEAAYAGGRKHWTDVIKNSGPADAIFWRQPEEDFNVNSTLIVMPGEEAIFVKGGVIEQVFSNGTYKLETENYPFISRLRNAFSGGISTFNCVVFFFRKAHSREILWGTSSPLQVRDKLLGIATKLKARGVYKIQISNPQVVLTKLLGSITQFEGQQDIIDEYFFKEFQGKIRECLTRAFNETQTELIGIEARLGELAGIVELVLAPVLDAYGIKLINFSFEAIEIDDDEIRRRYDEIGMDAIAKLRNAQADKNVMGILGEDWGRQQAANILGTLAENPGAGGVAAAGGALGMGFAAGNAFSNMSQQMFSPIHDPNAGQNPQVQPSGRFTQRSAGNPPDNNTVDSEKMSPVEALKQLKEMLDLGLIDQGVYDAKQTEILNRM